ncbi:hypothetical protein QBC42DRAFT_34539 [Cladorrhinum samala]|uniref:BHLH domain-containing protein n=1 Tax=Cladorrhinum samala TaxID=585594 RepID=A0AAV9HCM7_9PEZI|nr:hypothetical protein QBC42DRAFT_34539 [Cladorrhinum samala]
MQEPAFPKTLKNRQPFSPLTRTGCLITLHLYNTRTAPSVITSILDTPNTDKRCTMASSSSGLPQKSPDGEDDQKPRLTDEEKKANHIASEQKRRQAIRDAFDRISTIVPGLEGQARSEGIVLNSTIEYIRLKMRERRDMIAEADARGITIPADLRASVEMLPEGFLDDEPSSPGEDSSVNQRVIAKPVSRKKSTAKRPSSQQSVEKNSNAKHPTEQPSRQESDTAVVSAQQSPYQG